LRSDRGLRTIITGKAFFKSSVIEEMVWTAALLADERPIGVLGEVNPEALERLGLDYPVAAFEVSLDRLLEVLQGGNTG